MLNMQDNRLMVQIHDVALVYVENKPSYYIRIENMIADPMQPDGWKIDFSVLGAKIIKVTWLLRECWLKGDEFEFNKIPHRLEIIVPDIPIGFIDGVEPEAKKKIVGRKVIPLKPEFEKYCYYEDVVENG